MTLEPESKYRNVLLGALGSVLLLGLFLAYRSKVNDTELLAQVGVEANNSLGMPSETVRQADIAGIRAFMGDERYSATFVDTGMPTRFIVGKTEQIRDGVNLTDIPDEWKRKVHKYQSAQTVGANCQVYGFEVFADTHEVVEVHLEDSPTGAKNCEVNQSLGADGIFKPEMSETRIRELGEAFFARATAHVEGKDLRLKVTPVAKDGGAPDRYEFLWEDMKYKVPEAFDAIPKHPTIRFYISSGGILLAYENSIPLFAAAYRSEELTLEGTYICLPHKGAKEGEPQDGDCQTGIRTEKGHYYSMDWNVINPVLEIGDRFRVSGTFTPIETISSDHLRNNYDVRGIFSAKPPIKKL